MKKYLWGIAFILVCCFIPTLNAKASGEIQMSKVNTLPCSDSYCYTRVAKSNPNYTDVIVKGYYSYNYKMVDMVTGVVLKEAKDHIMVNDSGTYYVIGDSKVEDNEGNYVKLDISFLYIYSFLPNSNIVVGKDSQNNIMAYDVETKELIFKRTIPEDTGISVAKDIYFSGSNFINIINSKGEFINILEFDSKITDFEVTPDYKFLIVATKDQEIQIFETNNYSLIPSSFKDTKGSSFLSVDPTNKYMGLKNSSGRFELYDFEKNYRISTPQDETYVESSIVLSKGAKFILINDQVYSGKNLSKAVESIHFLEDYKVLEVGEEYTPTIEIRRADGTTEIINKQVAWTPNNLNLAYIKSNSNIIATRAIGQVSLKVAYAAFELQQVVDIKDTKAPIFKGINNISGYAYTGVKSMYKIEANDANDGDVTNKIKVTGAFNPNKPGKYKLTYTVSDEAGNEQKATRTIEIKYNPIKNMYYDSENNIYLPKTVYTSKYIGKYDPFIGTYIYKQQGKVYTHFDLSTKTSKELGFKQLKIHANGKTLTTSISKSTYYSYDREEHIYKTLSTKERQWIEKNVSLNKKVAISIVTKKKTYKKTLNKNEVQGLYDVSQMYYYLKSK